MKATPEAKTYLFMSEHYKFLKIIQNKKLRRIVKQLQEKTSGELIVLFGSYAKGLEKKSSDVDVFIQTKDRKLRDELREISDELSVKIGELKKDDLLSKEIIKDHVILQNIELFYKTIQ